MILFFVINSKIKTRFKVNFFERVLVGVFFFVRDFFLFIKNMLNMRMCY